MTHRALCASLIACMASFPVYAGDMDVRVLVECRQTGTDPSLIKIATLPPGGDCAQRNLLGASEILDDDLGVRWQIRPRTGRVYSHEIVDPGAERSIQDRGLKACVRVHSGTRMLDVWFVERSASCDGREPQSALYRRYVIGLNGLMTRTCIMPNGMCISYDVLSEEGKKRALETYARAHQILNPPAKFAVAR